MSAAIETPAVARLRAGAARWRDAAAILAALALALGLLALVAGLLSPALRRLLPAEAPLVALAGAGLLLAAAGLGPAALLLAPRSRLGDAGEGEGAEGSLSRLAGWPQVLAAALAAAPALLAALALLRGDLAEGIAAGTEGALAGLVPAPGPAAPLLAILLGFPVLVFERHLAAAPPADFPEAAALARLVRVPLALLVGGGIALLLLSLGLAPAIWGLRVLALLAALVAAELLLRAGARLFLPPPEPLAARALGDSAVAALLLAPRGAGSVGALLEDRFGIDLSRSWALAFMRRAFLPVTLLLALLAWGLSGLVTLRAQERGVYERLGAPAAVLGPGLHAVLPWPLGKVRRTELGTVHSIPVLAGALAPPLEPPPGDAAQGAWPKRAGEEQRNWDRLWDESHPSEVSYLIPATQPEPPAGSPAGSQTGSQPGPRAAGGRTSFQLVDLDLRLVWRIGLSDAAAIDALYHVADPEALLRAAAGRLLLRYFSTRTLSGLLGEDPQRLGEELRRPLQEKLDAAASGVEVLAVIVDSIHPPPAAAPAYHRVQAAEIMASAGVATQRRTATREIGKAMQDATSRLDGARGEAAATLSEAAIDRARFEADREGWAAGGAAMALERRLEAIERGFASARLIIVDDRLDPRGSATVDLRDRVVPAPLVRPAAPAKQTGSK